MRLGDKRKLQALQKEIKGKASLGSDGKVSSSQLPSEKPMIPEIRELMHLTQRVQALEEEVEKLKMKIKV